MAEATRTAGGVWAGNAGVVAVPYVRLADAALLADSIDVQAGSESQASELNTPLSERRALKTF